MQKFISFENADDLRVKLEAYEEIINNNKAATKEFLILKNIPYQEAHHGIGVDLSSVTPDTLEQYMQIFQEMNDITMDSFKDLGIVFVTEPNQVEINIKLGIQCNINKRIN